MLSNYTIKLKLIFFNLFFSADSRLACDAVLIANSIYYRNLSESLKQQFIIRTLFFLSKTHFDSESGFNLDKEKKIIISSAFVQLTFGLNLFWFKNFRQIFVAPGSYSYKNNELLFDGDVNLVTKKVNMSWPAIQKGFKIADDALNLCIHEFGHCLFFENLKRPYTHKIFKEKFIEEWRSVALKKINKIHRNENIVLRDYAATNFLELFSVSLESFFEQGTHFKQNEPELYSCMVKMLRQDPSIKYSPIII